MAPSRESLVEFLNHVVHNNLIADWFETDGKLEYSERQVVALLCYMIKVESIEADDAVSRFLHSASDLLSDYNTYVRNCPVLSTTSVAIKRIQVYESVISFLPEFRKFFRVSQFSETVPQKPEVLAAFADFLVQTLDCEPRRRNEAVENRFGIINEDIRFLVYVLGDAPFRSTEIETSKRILDKMEDVCNIAGDLVYSFCFKGYDVETKEMDGALDHLLERIDLLKSHIKNHCIESSSSVASHTAAIDSLFNVDSLLDDLDDLTDKKSELALNVKDDIRALYEALLSSRSLVNEMKVPLQTEVKELQEQIMQMRDAAYEAEYVINSFVSGEFPIWYLTLRLSNIVPKIRSIQIALEENKKKYESGVLADAYDNGAASSSQVKGTPLLNDVVVGLEDEENQILEMLVGGKPKHLQLINIFGMPGLGKTTLAKKLFNHPSVVYYFDKCVWTVVSQTYHKKNLLINILSSLIMSDRDSLINMDEDSLATQIYQTLKGRRYLAVMDDIWDSNIWDGLRRYFPEDENGSRVLFTSRNKNGAPSNSVICTIPLLSEDQCWSLIEKKVFIDTVCPPQLLSIGKKIAANCGGLPLATVAIAGILANVDKIESIWKKVEGSMSSYIITDQETSCIHILELSYKHLPDHLKPCFLYFGAFPEDAQVSARRLIPLWIAEGFIRKDKNKCLHNVGEDYLDELIDRSLVIVDQHKSSGGVKSCHIHDLWRDLCLIKAGKENFLKFIKKNYSIYERHHRLSVGAHSGESMPSSIIFRLQPIGPYTRSILGQCWFRSFCFSSIKLIRILDMLITYRDKDDDDLDEIGLHLHLRYLAMQCKFIPPSLGKLVNLEYCKFECFHATIMIPAWLLKLRKLRHLHVRNEAKFERDCKNSLEVNNLLTLSFVQILDLSDVNILRCSPNLRQLKCKCKSIFPDLRFLVQLDTLRMEFIEIYNFAYSDINFPENIRKLTLSGLGLPWKEMTVIGRLPSLEVLKLERRAFVGKTWETCENEFQKLKFLKLKNLELEEWNAMSEHFPVLQRVVLVSCYKLMSIPFELGDIPTLQLIELQWCNNLLKESTLQIQEEQHDSGNTELKAIVKNIFSEISELKSALREQLTNYLLGDSSLAEIPLEVKLKGIAEIVEHLQDLDDVINIDMDELKQRLKELNLSRVSHQIFARKYFG